jgi:hypothetical protein
MKKPIQRLDAAGAKVGGIKANPDAMTPRMKAKFAPFVPRDRVAGEATPRVITVMNPRNIYRPAKHNTDGLRVSL